MVKINQLPWCLKYLESSKDMFNSLLELTPSLERDSLRDGSAENSASLDLQLYEYHKM